MRNLSASFLVLKLELDHACRNNASYYSCLFLGRFPNDAKNLLAGFIAGSESHSNPNPRGPLLTIHPAYWTLSKPTAPQLGTQRVDDLHLMYPEMFCWSKDRQTPRMILRLKIS